MDGTLPTRDDAGPGVSDVGMENDGTGHTHMWQRDGGACVCGEPVPAYLVAAWSRYASRTEGASG